MYKVDYHHHSRFSFDGKDCIEDICKVAVEKNLSEICFTEHFDVDPKDVSFGFLDYKKYHDTVEQCKIKYGNKLKIRCGLEIGEPHLKAYVNDLKQELAKMKLDFIIGSVHNLNSVKLRLTMPGKNVKEFYQDYFQEIMEMVKTADIDVIGHLDLMKRYAFNEYSNYDFIDFEEIIRVILQTAIERNIGIEINTSGLRNSVKEIYPKKEIVKLYRELGGEIVTIGSDSHSCKDTFSGCEVGYEMLTELGYKYIYTFEERKSIRHNLK